MVRKLSGAKRAAAVLLLLLCAGAAPNAEREEVPLFHGNEHWTGDLDGMLERQRIRVLVVESRTHYFLDGAVQRGLAYDALQKFAEELNREQHAGVLRTEVVFRPMRQDELLPALLEGRGDLAVANLSITPERSQFVDFSIPAFRNVREIVVTGPASPPLASLDDLSGKELLVRPSSSYFTSLWHLNQAFAKAQKPPVRIRPAPEALDDEDLLEMLNEGLIPLVVVDDHLARFWKQVLPAITPRDDLAVHEGGDIAWAFRKNSPKLRAEVDAFLTRHRIGTLETNMELREYLRSTRHVDKASVDTQRRRFAEVAKYFQSYGDRYGFDWLLVAAQGYRESGLDQQVRSPVGAIGIMQLMPPTGEAMGVGSIYEAENNVHAGVKYMRTMLDVYFKDASLSAEDRALFAFAAYNAGPGRVARLRAEAEKTGLDPNRWFGSVERVAARRIGQETVRYVRDIYKYYIAYRLTRELDAERERMRRELEEHPTSVSKGDKP
jgi:membrane-bound lytic murein transglycosylase MltF